MNDIIEKISAIINKIFEYLSLLFSEDGEGTIADIAGIFEGIF